MLGISGVAAFKILATVVQAPGTEPSKGELLVVLTTARRRVKNRHEGTGQAGQQTRQQMVLIFFHRADHVPENGCVAGAVPRVGSLEHRAESLFVGRLVCHGSP